MRAEANGRIVDICGQLVRQIGPNGEERRWTYNGSGGVVRYRDYDGSTFTSEYSSWNLRSKEIDPLGNAVSYRYASSQKLAAVVDANGALTEHIHDHKDRLVQVRRHGVIEEEYRYDEGDNYIEKLDGKGQTLLRFEIGPNRKRIARHL